jgi:hypothetical protein
MVCGCIPKADRHYHRTRPRTGSIEVSLRRSRKALSLLVLIRFNRGSVDPPIQKIISASLFMHPGFIIVDHIHFQYNAFMYGILLWSVLMARNVPFLSSKSPVFC